MAVDPTPLMRKVADLVDELAAEYGADATMTNALIVVEVARGDGYNVIEHRALNDSTAHALGMAQMTAASLTEPEGE